eukprot:9380063-Alexandrium_andersonii.AAC.1
MPSGARPPAERAAECEAALSARLEAEVAGAASDFRASCAPGIAGLGPCANPALSRTSKPK